MMLFRCLPLLIAATACSHAPPASIKNKGQPPNVCATNPAFRQFDFWLGAWDVFDEQGIKKGENSITTAEDGCLLVERWTSASGTTGQSYNFFDPVTAKWRQVWVSRGMVIDYEGSLQKNGTMRLVGQIHYHDGRSLPFVGEWKPRPDGSVRQHFEELDPTTNTWKPWFTGIYVRKGRS